MGSFKPPFHQYKPMMLWPGVRAVNTYFKAFDSPTQHGRDSNPVYFGKMVSMTVILPTNNTRVGVENAKIRLKENVCHFTGSVRAESSYSNNSSLIRAESFTLCFFYKTEESVRFETS